MRSKLACATVTCACVLASACAWLLAADAAGAAPALDQSHGLRGTARYDAGLYTAYCPRGARSPAADRVRTADAAADTVLALEAPGAAGGDGETSGETEEGPAGEEDGETQWPEDEAGGSAQEATAFEAQADTVAHAASTSEAGWPAKQCLKMDKGTAGERHTLVGLDGVHNWLLGGYGNDTIIGGNLGDVIWADYHPSGEPPSQTAVIEAGSGRSVIYANDTHNVVWTGTNPHTVVHAHVSGISGVIHCQSPGIVVYLSTTSERHFKLDGCRHISHYSVGY
jgi:hypothetical protein